MNERLILPHQPERIIIIDSSGAEVEISPDDMRLYGPDAFRSDGETVEIVSLDELPRDKWMNEGEE